jgi:hypothetical protein
VADVWAVPKVHSHLIKTFPGSKFGIQLSLAVGESRSDVRGQNRTNETSEVIVDSEFDISLTPATSELLAPIDPASNRSIVAWLICS